MHIIETLFGISPDGGSGLTEALYLAAIGAAVAAVLVGRRLLNSSRPPHR